MNPDPRTASSEHTRASTATPPASGLRQSLVEIRDLVIELWWRFFDWLAVVSWKKLLLVSLFVLIVAGGVFNHPDPAALLIFGSIVVKVLAGGKRRAEITAGEATRRAQTEQLERMVVEARMQALQAQIEPHFLFNTLASIDQLITTDPPRASKMQQSLIRYLRSALPQMRENQRPTLGQQVDLCAAFLEIMTVRMESRLAWGVAVPDGLRSAVFPSMMLQTLVENSIRHGLEPKLEGGRIDIAADVTDGRLVVRVRDTGVGFMPKGDGGVGLANIRERLEALYGNRAELAIEVPSYGGTCATITVPYEIAPAAAA